MRQPLLASFALPLLSLALPAAAQESDPLGATRVTFGGPPVYATLELDTGRLVTSSTPLPNQGSVPRGGLPCYENNVDQNDLVADGLLLSQHDEIFDWGTKACAGSDFVRFVTIGYGSQADVSVGGSLTLRLYAGATGNGNFGTRVLELPLTGLMSQGDAGGVGGPITPYYLTVDLGRRSVFLPDGPIAWSYENVDGLTAPILVDAGAPGTGTANAFDVYRPAPASPATYLGTFTLPAGPNSHDPLENSFFIEIEEDTTLATATVLTAAGSIDVLSSLTRPLFDQNWVMLADHAGGGALGSVVFLGSTRLPDVPTPLGPLMVDPDSRVAPVSISTNGLHRYRIPANAALLGETFYAQGVLVGGAPLRLTNALEITVGTL